MHYNDYSLLLTIRLILKLGPTNYDRWHSKGSSLLFYLCCLLQVVAMVYRTYTRDVCLRLFPNLQLDL